MTAFVWPWAIFVIVLPILARYFAPMKENADGVECIALRVPFMNRISGFSKQAVNTHPLWQECLFFVSWGLFVLALMRPITYGEPITTPQQARNIMLTIDVSGSMGERDYVIKGRLMSRLNVVKHVVKDFLEKRLNDNFGLVIFASKAYLYAPLSYDKTTIQALFDEVRLGIAGTNTAIGDALVKSVEGVLHAPENSRVVILLSDGDSHDTNVAFDEGVEFAKQNHVKVYTIGIGRLPNDYQNTSAQNSFNEPKLKQIADMTNGYYFHASTSDELLTVYRTIDELEQVETAPYTIRPQTEWFFVPLLGAMISLCMYIMLKGRLL